MIDRKPLRIFVAMPVETMGTDAPWDDVKEIRRKLLSPAAAEIGRRLSCDIKLVIEDEKKKPGDIASSMFAEASDADVYIADLTGFSANVFLELGVRWAVKDGVTILIAQDTSNLKFNVAPSRAIKYGPMPTQLEGAILDIAEYAVSGLTNEEGICDSPVRRGIDLLSVPRAELQSLKSELARLREQQGEDLVRAAEVAEGARHKMELLRRAISVNPVNFRAHLMLGQLLREVGQYEESENELNRATHIAPDSAPAWRELGTTQSKRRRLSDASRSLSTSLDLEPGHAETWRVIGGLRRRLSRLDGAIRNWQELLHSREAYHHASELEPDDSYSLFNYWLLSLIIAMHDSEPIEPIINQFGALKLLCQYKVLQEPNDPWKRLDLSATLAILEMEEEAIGEVENALRVAGETSQISYVDSAIPPLKDLLQVLHPDSPKTRAVTALIERMNAAIDSVGS
jgi:tetratricopeptide (TPR) repeat protein